MPSHILKDDKGRPTHVILTIEEYCDLQKALTSHPTVTESLKRLHDPTLKTYTMEEVARLVFGNNIRACRERAGLTQEGGCLPLVPPVRPERSVSEVEG